MITRIRKATVAMTIGGAAVLAALALPAGASSQAATQGQPAVLMAQAAAPATAGQQGQWLSLRQIYDKLEADGYTDIREIERERSGYEAKVRDRDGRKMKLYIEPLTGKVINSKIDD